MGRLKEKYWRDAAAEYEKRLKGYCQFKLLELPEVRLPDNPSPAEIQAGLEKEAEMILTKIPKGSWFCTLTPEGKMLSSDALADKLAKKSFMSEAVQKSWKVHMDMFGPILEPAFKEDYQSKVHLGAALNLISRKDVKKGFERLPFEK